MGSVYELDIEDNRGTILALRSGREDVFDAVYKHYFNKLCAFLSHYVAKEVAIDIVQSTMMWLWENRETLIVELSLKSLLFTIVKNKALDNISHNQIKYRVHQNIINKYKEELDNIDLTFENELLDMFAEAIKKLPDNFRLAFEMNRFDGKTHKAIAEELNVSPQTVNYHISQAMKLLRKDLKDYLPILLIMLK